MTIQTPNDESDADRTSTLENKGKGGLTKAKTKEYLRDWPAAGELPDDVLATLERWAQELLAHGVGLSVEEHDARFRFGLVRYTDRGVRASIAIGFNVTPGADSQEQIDRFVRNIADTAAFVQAIFAHPLNDDLPGVEAMAMGNGGDWMVWPEDGDARFGEEEARVY